MSKALKRSRTITKDKKKVVQLQTPDSALDPLSLLMKKADEENGKRYGKQESDTKQNKKKKRLVKSQKTVRVVQKPQVSMMAMAMRLFFIQSLKRFLASGEMQSKYLRKFEVSSNSQINFRWWHSRNYLPDLGYNCR